MRLLRIAPLAALALSACEPEIVPAPYVPSDAHDAYRHGLAESGLADTALGRDWLRSAEDSVASPLDIDAPLRETVYVDSGAAFAVGYRFAVARGERTEIRLELEPASDWRIYLDLFRPRDDGAGPPVHVASAGEGDRRLEFEPRRDGEYILRVQSELLRGGSVTVEVRNGPSLDFPVSGKDTRAIGSVFGAERDGGRREHHGVDIFAPRHTPVLATSRARVRRVADWKLGGHVVWLEDPTRGLRLYFAHLQTQDVEEGSWVEPGDLIGTVGNSGNARTTAPHLHFGIYVRGEGPIDPFPFLREPRRSPRPVTVAPDHLGRWIRTRRETVSLMSDPRRGQELFQVPPHTPVLVHGGSGDRYRVALPNGIQGYLRERSTEPLGRPLGTLHLEESADVLDRPDPRAAVRARLAAGSEVPVLGRYDGFAWVETTDSGPSAPSWVRPSAPSAPAAAAP